MKALVIKNPEKILTLLVFTLIISLFLLKLDYNYFFTDEILYIQKGEEYFNGIFENTLQVPPLPKLIAGTLYLTLGSNLYLLRLPYAIIGVLTSFLIYLVLKKEYGVYYGLVGALLFSTSKIIFNSSRMVMLEPLMHFFWILFHYYYLQTFKSKEKKLLLLSGLFLGLSLSVKITSIILVAFTIIFFIYRLKTDEESPVTLTKNYLLIAAAATGTIVLSYLKLFFRLGIYKIVLDTLKDVKDVYINKSDIGKTHVIGNQVYDHSPWWTYFYYHFSTNGLVRSVFYIATAAASLFQKSFFVVYWALFTTLSFAFHQFSGVKNERYVSSIEIPLIILAVSGIYFIYKKYTSLAKFLVLITLATSLFGIGHYLYRLKYTEYLGLYKYFKKETHNFSEYKRLYVFGSIRSMKWYRDLVPDKNMFIYRKDYAVMCPEFPLFDYFAFDKTELLKDPSNFLYLYVKENESYFESVPEIEDMLVYKKMSAFNSKLNCPEILK